MKKSSILLTIAIVNYFSLQAVNSINLPSEQQSITYLEEEIRSLQTRIDIEEQFSQHYSSTPALTSALEDSKNAIEALKEEVEHLNQSIIAIKEAEIKLLIRMRSAQKKAIYDIFSKEEKRRYLYDLVRERKEFLDRDRNIADLIRASQASVQTQLESQSEQDYRTLPIFRETKKLPITRKL